VRCFLRENIQQFEKKPFLYFPKKSQQVSKICDGESKYLDELFRKITQNVKDGPE
jgi:hypothetical protein